MNDIYLDQLYRTRHPNKIVYQPPIIRLSDHKRKLVSGGLPVNIVSGDLKTHAIIDINNRGDLVLSYRMINGVKSTLSMYLIDAKDEIINQCYRF